MTTFKVPCPSCEAKVLIKNPNLIGTKVECPKCKYRFKVEEPKDQAPADEGKPANKDAKSTADGKKGAAKSKKKLLAAVLAVVAIGLLAAGGYVIFGGDGKKPAKPGGASTYAGGNNTPPPNTGGEDPNQTDKDKKDAVPPKPVSSVPASDKDATNLLPGQSVAVYRFDLDGLRLTPLGTSLFDEVTTKLFKNSMGFEVANVGRYFHCIVGEKERAPFGLICLKEPVLEKDIAIVGAGKAKQVNGRNLMPVKGNQFLTAVGSSFSGRSLFADLYEVVPATATSSKEKELALGACIYDTQHIAVGDYAVLEMFLAGLKDGYPEFLTVYKKDVSDPMTPMSGAPPVPGGPAPGVLPPPTPGGPMPVPPPLTPTLKNRDYTSNPSYLSVSSDLKQMLNALEEEPGNLPSLVMAEKFHNDFYPRKGVKKAYEPLAKMIDPVLDRTLFLGLNLTNFSPRQCSMTIRIVGKTAAAARQIALEHLTPALNDAVPLLSLMLDTQIALRNFADPNAKPPGTDTPGTGFPNPGGPGPPPGAGGPGTAPGLPPPSGGSAGGPPPGSADGPPPGAGPGRAPGLPSPGGPMGPGLPFPGGPMGPGLPFPGGPMGPGGNPLPPTSTNPTSQIDLRLVDQNVTINVTINWTEDVYGQFVFPRLFGLANQLKGKTTVYAGSNSWTGLADAVKKYVEQKKKFPAATIPRRPSDSSRLGLMYPPIQRVSFFYELLPYLNRGNVSNNMSPDAAWFDKANAAAADSWVPEFLVPYYDQSSWRATSPLAPDRVLGGTNFVAIAGVGRDAARYSPKNPAHQKLVGISGYDFGSTVEDVTDGLENTIYLMQVPPELTRPWAAGGGATALGLNPDDPMADFKHRRPDGQWGTYAIMGDGTVRWIPADIKPADLLALATRAGGEKLSGELNAIVPRVDASGRTVVELKAELKATEPKATEPKAPAKPIETAPSPKEKP